MKLKFIGQYERVITELRKEFKPNEVYEITKQELEIIAQRGLQDEFEEVKETKK